MNGEPTISYYHLPQDILTTVFSYDDTYKHIFKTQVMKELQTKIIKNENMVVIKTMKIWSKQSYLYPCTVYNNNKNVSFFTWYFTRLNTDTRATKKIQNTNLNVICQPVSVIDGDMVVPYDLSCTYMFDLEDDDDDSSFHGMDSENDISDSDMSHDEYSEGDEDEELNE